MKRILVAMLLCAACKHATSSSSETHSETSTVTDTQTSESGSQTTVTTTTEAPGKTTTTVEEFSQPEEVMPPVPDERGSESSPSGTLPATQGVVSRPSHGPLVRRTVTVTERGQETTQTTQQASTQGTAATETKAEAKGDTKAQAASETKPAAGCIGASWLWGLAALAFAGLLIFGAIRLRRAV